MCVCVRACSCVNQEAFGLEPPARLNCGAVSRGRAGCASPGLPRRGEVASPPDFAHLLVLSPDSHPPFPSCPPHLQ